MASKRRLRRRSCESKFRYDNKDGAYRESRRLRRVHNTKKYHVYSCSFCGGWHVGRWKLAPSRKRKQW